MKSEIRIESKADEVGRLLEWVGPILAATPLDKLSAFGLQCALVEVVNNSIQHAYQFEEGHTIDVQVRSIGDRVEAVIRDQGPAFTPPADPQRSDTMAHSGRGQEIIHAWVDEYHVERIGDWNVFTLARRYPEAN